jgi:hypothetical protein
MRMRIKLVWKEALALALLGGAIDGAIAWTAITTIEDRRTHQAIGIGAVTMTLILIGALGGRWVRRLHDQRALAER